ncbi:MAG: 50S ribosomal protein L22 [Patescibacteria group bacterium]|jgi:large subunit ribosomal protein L22
MEIKAKLNNLILSPKKVRLVVNLVRGLKTKKALEQLAFANKKAALPVSKLIKSAIANAEHNYELDKNNLFIKEIRVDEAGMLHRWTPKAHGSATPIRKRLSHIILTLSEIKDSGVKVAKKREVEAPLSLSEMAKKETSSKENKDTKDSLKKEEKFAGNKTDAAGRKGFVNKIFQRKSGNS